MSAPHLRDVSASKAPEPAAGVTGGDGGGGVESRLARLETHISYLATKQDISDLKVLIESNKVSIESIKVLIEAREARMMRWLAGTMLTTMLALITFLARVFFIS